MEIRVIGVLGAGSMGNGIAQVAAQAGYQVVMRDIEDRFVENGLRAIEKFLAKSVEKEKMSEDKKGISLEESKERPRWKIWLE
jgi:3-hydroxybutyryl-CoA dehydrogenase